MAVSAISPVSAANVTPQNTDPVQHFMDCLGVLFNDSNAHHEFCGPNEYVPSGQLAPTFSSPDASCPVIGSRDLLAGEVKVASLTMDLPFAADQLPSNQNPLTDQLLARPWPPGCGGCPVRFVPHETFEPMLTASLDWGNYIHHEVQERILLVGC